MLVIAALGTGNLVVAAASIVKAFSQRTLNKTFDAMTNGAKGLLDTNVSLEKKVAGMVDTYNNVKGTIEDLKGEIVKLNTDGILEELRKSFKELEVYKEALDYKDAIIEAYQRDLTAIKVALMNIEGKGGYDDLLQIEAKTQVLVQNESSTNTDNVGDSSTDQLESE